MNPLGRIDEGVGYAVPEPTQTPARPPTYNKDNCPAAQLGGVLYGDGVSMPLNSYYLDKVNVEYQIHDLLVARSFESSTTDLENIPSDEGYDPERLRPSCFYAAAAVPVNSAAGNETPLQPQIVDEQELRRLPLLVQRHIHDQSCFHESFVQDQFGYPTKTCQRINYVPMGPIDYPPSNGCTMATSLRAGRCSSRGTSSSNCSGSTRKGSRGRGSPDYGTSIAHTGGQFGDLPGGGVFEDPVYYDNEINFSEGEEYAFQ